MGEQFIFTPIIEVKLKFFNANIAWHNTFLIDININSSNTKRYQESAVPYLQGLLNKDHFDKKQRLKNLFKDKCSQKFLNFEN